MAHKCYISFKTEDKEYKRFIQEDLKVDMIDKSLNEPIESTDEEYIMRKIREEYLQDSTVTIFLIGAKSNENLGLEEQKYIKRELQATLYNSESNPRGGILGVVLPNMYNNIYKGQYQCRRCGSTHTHVALNSETVIDEFSCNYYIKPHERCSWSDDERYCILVKWDDFKLEPERYIEQAFQKREAPVSNKITVYPK